MVTASYSGTSVTIGRWPQHFNPHQQRLDELKYRMHASGTEGKYAYKPIANRHCLRFALAALHRTYHGRQFHAETRSVLISVSDWITDHIWTGSTMIHGLEHLI
jgi:hypothetical protein